MSDSAFNTIPPNRVKRIAERASYDRETIYAILDAGYVCHIGFVADARPVVIPMTYWRDGDDVYFHSANKGRFADACAHGPVCLTVTHFDGLVLGHSAMNHSCNYRSVVMHGQAEVVADHAAKRAAMQTFVEHVIPGRWDQLRPIRDNEIRAITLMRLKLNQASAKVRDAWPDQEEVDPGWPVWVGVLPAQTRFGAALADPARNAITPAPDHVSSFAGRDRFVPGYDGS